MRKFRKNQPTNDTGKALWSLRKILKLYLSAWCGQFVKSQNFGRILGDSHVEGVRFNKISATKVR